MDKLNEDETKYGYIVSAMQETINAKDVIYLSPQKQEDTSTEKTLDDVMGDAETFLDKADDLKYDPQNLQYLSKTIYNILFTAGVVIAVVVGAIIGIKIMTSSASEQAEYKKLLIPYVIGCIVVFGGFMIWKIAVYVIQGVAL